MMRGLAIIALIVFLGLNPGITPAATSTQSQPQIDLIESEPPDQVYPFVLAAGALAGVMTVNWLTYNVGKLPLYVGVETLSPPVSPAAAAASRIFVITSGVLGAWIADVLYR